MRNETEHTRPERSKTDFTAIYEQYFDRIYRYIYYKTGHRESAEDLTAKTFLKAYENRHRFDPERGAYAAWLYRIARNTVIDHFRTSNTKEAPLDSIDPASDVDIQSEAEDRELRSEVRRLLDTLKPKQRDVVMLRLWEELPYKKIAEALGTSEAACKMSFSRAVVSLRKAMTTGLTLMVFAVGLILSGDLGLSGRNGIRPTTH